MMLAEVDGQRLPALPGLVGRCEICDGKVVPKCGQIVVWHWAHEALQDCDTWAEPMTWWHADWQAKFPQQYREVRIHSHRADVCLPNGRVIELQHSGIDVDAIRAREDFYADMIWLFNAADAVTKGRLELRVKDWKVAPGLKHCSLRWRYPRRSVFYCRKPVFFDIGNGHVLHLRRLYPNAPHGGWGTIYPINKFLSDCAGLVSLEIGPEAVSGQHVW